MIRILVLLVILVGVALGFDWLLHHPGHVELTWLGYDITMSAAVAVAALLLSVLALVVLWSLLRLIFGLPSFAMLAARQRRREKGYAALSRGLIAVGAGDSRGARRAALVAAKHLKNDPLAIVLRAQAAHLSGDGAQAEAAYGELAQRDDTHVLGLRGLHDEARQRGDQEAARHFAAEAHRATPLPWSAETMIEHRASDGDWEKALATVETSAAAKLVDRKTSDRQRAVLETALGLEKQDVAPEEALTLARSAMKRAPDLVPAIGLAARLLTRKGEIRKAVKLIENAWPRCPHPELARIYLDVRPGDSTSDRLVRARALMRISSFDPVSRLTVARTALAAKNFPVAREAMAPLIAEGKRPSVRTCLAMADIEDAEFGDKGQWREWLARASRAPLDPAWIADGIVYDQWEPASPTTGRLDAFVWQAPADRPGHAMEAMPAAPATPDLEPAGTAPVAAPLQASAAPAIEDQSSRPDPVDRIIMRNQAESGTSLVTASEDDVSPTPPVEIETITLEPARAMIAPPREQKTFMRSVIVAPDDPGVKRNQVS